MSDFEDKVREMVGNNVNAVMVKPRMQKKFWSMSKEQLDGGKTPDTNTEGGGKCSDHSESIPRDRQLPWML